MIDVSDLIGQVEPILKQPLQFYGSYLQLKNEDKVSVLENELVLYHKGLLRQKEMEYDALKVNHDFVVGDYNEKLERLKEVQRATHETKRKMETLLETEKARLEREMVHEKMQWQLRVATVEDQ